MKYMKGIYDRGTGTAAPDHSIIRCEHCNKKLLECNCPGEKVTEYILCQRCSAKIHGPFLFNNPVFEGKFAHSGR